MRALYMALSAIAVMGLGSATVLGQERQGRYTLSPVENGVVRLDTQTGAMSLCARRDGKWSCEPMDDEARSMREQIDRLRAENQRLQDQIALVPRDARPRERLELPSEEDIDKALDYVERMFRKFRDRIKEFDQDRKGTSL